MLHGTLEKSKYRYLIDIWCRYPELHKGTASSDIDNKPTSTYIFQDLTHHMFDGFGKKEVACTGGSYTELFLIKHSVKQKMTIRIQHTTGDYRVFISLNPNRFLNSANDEKILEILNNEILPLLQQVTIAHLDMNIDIPYNFQFMALKYHSQSTLARATLIQDENESKVVKLSKKLKPKTDKNREVIIYDKVAERLEPESMDDSYISKTYVRELKRQHCPLTRIETRLLSTRAVKAFLSDYKNGFKGFTC